MWIIKAGNKAGGPYPRLERTIATDGTRVAKLTVPAHSVPALNKDAARRVQGGP